MPSPPPQAIAATPASGNVASQTFSFTFSDPNGNGWQNLSVVDVLINSYLDGIGACYFAFQPILTVQGNSGYVSLVDDAGDSGYAPGSPMYLAPGSGSVLQNSQCSINVAASTVAASGQWLNLTVAITFKVAFAGNKIIYAAARDSITNPLLPLNSGWQALGNWSVPLMPTVSGPSAVSVSPGRGPDQMAADGSTTMTFTFADSSGYGQLGVVDVLINGFLDGINACYFAFAPTASNAGYLYLVDDAGGYVSGSPMYMDPTHGTDLHNTQCSINVAGSTASASGNTLTLTMNVTFFPSATVGGFNGNVAIYLAARDHSTGNSGWQALGSWYVGTSTNPSVVLTTSVSELATCIGPSSKAVTCMLAPNSTPDQYQVNSTLNIQNPNLMLIEGGGGPGDTTLVRWSSSVARIMKNSGDLQSLTISNLTFDGNRYGFGTGTTGALSCLTPTNDTGHWDLDTSGGGTVTVEWTDFINAPGTALLLSGSLSTVSTSNFGQGGYGIGPAGTPAAAETAGATATRGTAVYVTDGTGAWYNAISYAGTAGITLAGAGQYAYGNSLYQNRYEISDGSGGGAVTLLGPDPNTGVQSSNAFVAGNVINGNLWPPQSSPPSAVNGCPFVQSIQQNHGIEAYGFGHTFENNELVNNTGSGMTLSGPCETQPPYIACPVGRITISGVNYYPNSNDSPKYIEGNQSGGITFRTIPSPPNSPPCYGPQTACGATLDNLLVVNNAFWGVNLSAVQVDTNDTNPINGSGYSGFISASCMWGNFAPSPPNPPNTLVNVTAGSPVGAGVQEFPTGMNYSSYVNPYVNPSWPGGSCPQNNGSNAAPAPSNIQGWPWTP